MSDLTSLYQEIILDHNRNPRNFRVMDLPDRSLEGYNPLCGDRYTIYLKMNGNVIEDISFYGSGCAISKASASVMTSVLKGKTIEEAEKIFEIFHQLVRGEKTEADIVEELERLAAFSGVSAYPARVKCAILPWHTMKSVLENESKAVSTE
ncbi:MAG: SUF system NifU family Fe-S cluster assembly protein [Bacteroidetes bacterium]|nr:SUF system NifU family Fe-S cluster assembly protein [Bacteroidota bacterium]